MKMAIFYLTCASEEEADEISQVLLDKRLVACAKKFPIASTFHWKGKIEEDEEVLVLFESAEENFEKADAEIKKLHSYETYIFYSVPVSQMSKGMEKWLEEELKS
jgi:periplasmic divalent cation tolerance protein